MDDLEPGIAEAADAIRAADALLLTAGAGMGVDSGLPDFRGPEGFWNAYPPYRHLGLDFMDLANPRWFAEDPELAWGFYGHRLMLYRRTAPHAGYGVLRRWAATRPQGAFVYTSNVDGAFVKAGLPADAVVECHGSLLRLQCLESCGQPVWPSDDVAVDVDEATFRARGTLPACPTCGGMARPNVVMFGDYGVDTGPIADQERRLMLWLGTVATGQVTIVECGAGTAVPSVRLFASRIQQQRRGVRLVRINVREPEGPPGTISLALGARDALTRIAAHLG